MNERTGKSVDEEQIVKGARTTGDEYVILPPAELEGIQPVRSRALEVEGFVDAGRIDPLWHDRAYYAEPDRGAARAYTLLYRVLADARRAALGRMILRQGAPGPGGATARGSNRVDAVVARGNPRS